MIASWRRQRRRVNRLYGRVVSSTRNETGRRQALKAWTTNSLFRFQTALWVSVAGAIWMSRRKNKDEDERGNQVAEILTSLWIMQRWRRLASRASDMLTPDLSRQDTHQRFLAGSPSNDEDGSAVCVPDP
ncbi:MAG: hypothetical protein WBS20_15600 [Lysobacterales bacterium]